jgi:hypothetical protein
MGAYPAMNGSSPGICERVDPHRSADRRHTARVLAYVARPDDVDRAPVALTHAAGSSSHQLEVCLEDLDGASTHGLGIVLTA